MRDYPNPNITGDAALVSPAMRYVREYSARGLLSAIDRLAVLYGADSYLRDDNLWEGYTHPVLNRVLTMDERVNLAINGGTALDIRREDENGDLLPVPARVVPYTSADEIPDTPYILFYSFGLTSEPIFSGSVQASTIITIEIRDPLFNTYVAVDDAVVRQLRQHGKLWNLISVLDDGPSDARGRSTVTQRSPAGQTTHASTRDRGNILRRIRDVEIEGR